MNFRVRPVRPASFAEISQNSFFILYFSFLISHPDLLLILKALQSCQSSWMRVSKAQMKLIGLCWGKKIGEFLENTKDSNISSSPSISFIPFFMLYLCFHLASHCFRKCSLNQLYSAFGKLQPGGLCNLSYSSADLHLHLIENLKQYLKMKAIQLKRPGILGLLPTLMR